MSSTGGTSMTCCRVTVHHKAGVTTYAVDVDVTIDGAEGTGTLTGAVKLRDGEPDPRARRLTVEEITDLLDADTIHAVAAQAIDLARSAHEPLTCLRCGVTYKGDPGAYRFCDGCFRYLDEEEGADLDEAEHYYRHARGAR